MDKKELRQYIAQQKRNYSVAQKTEWSSSLFQKLEGHPLFLQAHTLLLYHSLPDEVQTHEFIRRWHPYKRIVLPLVKERNWSSGIMKGRIHYKLVLSVLKNPPAAW